VVCGCGGSSAPPFPAASAIRAAVAPLNLAPGVKHVFISDSVGNVVTIYNKDGSSRQLMGFEESQLLATDRAGNLYVANTEAHNIEVFAPPYRDKPTLTISVAEEYPSAVAVAPDGTVAVIGCHASGPQCSGAGVVSFFAGASAPSPCATVRGTSALSALLSAALDARGTLYVAGLNVSYETSRLGQISGGCGAKRLMILRPNTKIFFAAGVAVDPKGNIATVDSGGPDHPTSIDVFAAPKPGSLKLMLLSQNPLGDSSVVASFALTKDGSKLYTAEPRVSLEYAYPQGGSSLGELSPYRADLIEGVAVTPAETP
jgi:DNA-binding beta-propeller fold protein YncE